MNSFVESFLATLASGGLLLGAAAYLFKQSFQRLLDKRMELFKQQLQVDSKVRELTTKSQIDFRERQLGELYGPIYAVLKRGKPIYKLWMDGTLGEIEKDIAQLFVEGNNRIVEIILSKSHLIDGQAVPESFTDFLTHVAIWHGYIKTKHRGVPWPKVAQPAAYFPKDFETNIFETTERLKRELYELHRNYGLVEQAARA